MEHLNVPPPQSPPSPSPSQHPESVTIKVVVPSSGVCKTVKLPVKIKVKELHEILTKKLSTLANAPQHLYEDYGFYWHSDSGPVWLSEGSSLRAYNFKPNVSIEFKKRLASSPVIGKPAKSKGKKDKKKSVVVDAAMTRGEVQAASPVQGQGESPKNPAARKLSAWVSSRPGSLYDQKKEKDSTVKSELKKERSQSVNITPRKDPETVVNAARFTSPSFSATFEAAASGLDTSPASSPRHNPISPRLGTPPSPLISPRLSPGGGLNDLDDLIDIFDDLTDEPFDSQEFSEERMLEAYAAKLEHEDLLEEEADARLGEMELSPRFTYATSPADTPPLSNGITRPRSYSSPHGPGYQASRPAHSMPATPESEPAPIEDDRKMPGLRGAHAKRDVNPTNAGVRLGAVTSILEDALEGIEQGSVDMTLMKHYVTSALCILRTIS